MAGLRRLAAEAPTDVRAGLLDRLRADERAITKATRALIAADGTVEVFVHPMGRWIAGLEEGRAVELPAFHLRGIADLPAAWSRVRVGPDGGLTRAGQDCVEPAPQVGP